MDRVTRICLVAFCLISACALMGQVGGGGGGGATTGSSTTTTTTGGPGAESGAWIPGYNQPVPLYFSGTYNRIGGSAYVYPPPEGQPPGTVYFVSAQLFIGLLPAGFWENPDPGFGPLSVGVHVIFDSTVFLPGQPVNVSFHAEDNYGRPYDALASIPVKNRALFYGGPDVTNGSGANGPEEAHDRLPALRYQRSLVSDTYWTWEQYAADQELCNLIYITAHGGGANGDSFHTDGTATEFQEALTSIYPDPYEPHTPNPVNANYWTFRWWAVGAGLPPFNQTARPMVNFAFLDACLCGNSSRWLSICEPRENIYGDILIDQAVLAYKVFTVVEDGEWYAEHLMDPLLLEQTVGVSLDMLIEDAISEGIGVWDEDPAYGGSKRQLVYEDFVILGDPFTRIVGLYTGNDNLPNGFARDD